MAALSHILCPACRTVNRVPGDRPAQGARCGQCHRGLFDGHAVPVDEAGLEQHLRSNSIPILLDVWAPWCGPCRQMTPAYEQAAGVLEPHVRLLKLNADEAPNICARLGVRGIPALYLFHDGSVLAQTAGAMPADAILRWAQDHLALQPS